MRLISRLCIPLGRGRGVGHDVDLPTYRAKLGRLGPDDLCQADLLLGGLCHFAHHYRRNHSHPPTAVVEDTAVAKGAKRDTDSSFLSGIFVSLYDNIMTR